MSDQSVYKRKYEQNLIDLVDESSKFETEVAFRNENKTIDDYVNNYKESIEHKTDSERSKGGELDVNIQQFDTGEFSLEEVAEAAKFVRKTQFLEIDEKVEKIKVDDNPVIFKNGKERGYFEKKRLRDKANEFNMKSKEYEAARLERQVQSWVTLKDPKAFSWDTFSRQNHYFKDEDIRHICTNDDGTYSDMKSKSALDRVLFGMQPEVQDEAYENSEQQMLTDTVNTMVEIDEFITTEECGRFIFSEKTFEDRQQALQPLVHQNYAGNVDNTRMIETLKKWHDDPEKFGFVRSEDPDANDGLNTAVLNELLQYNSYNQIFLGYSQKAEIIKDVYQKKLDNGGMTDEARNELIKKIRKLDWNFPGSVNRRGAILNGMMSDMIKDIRKHPGYKGDDAYPAEEQVDKKIVSLSERAKTLRSGKLDWSDLNQI